jgi:hypothetical protein
MLRHPVPPVLIGLLFLRQRQPVAGERLRGPLRGRGDRHAQGGMLLQRQRRWRRRMRLTWRGARRASRGRRGPRRLPGDLRPEREACSGSLAGCQQSRDMRDSALERQTV